jgi:hypothetical protein
MDPNNDVKSDIDYQAVLSHMNIHKGKKLFFLVLNISFFFVSDKFLHNNEASSNPSQTTVRDGSREGNNQDRTSIGSNYTINTINLNLILNSFRFSYCCENCSEKFSSFILFQ